jgi:hypothetical protein
MVLGVALESDHERVARHTREVAAAVDGRDWKTFRTLLDPKVKFDLFDAFNGADQLTAGAQKTADSVNVKDITVSGIEIKNEPGAYVVDFMATADVDIGGRRPTNWRFYWGKNADGSFSLYRIVPLPNPMLGTDPVIARFVKP